MAKELIRNPVAIEEESFRIIDQEIGKRHQRARLDGNHPAQVLDETDQLRHQVNHQETDGTQHDGARVDEGRG